MPKKYVVKTANGSFYEIQDHRHLFGQHKWIIIKDNIQLHIIALLHVRKDTAEIEITDFLGRMIVYGLEPTEVISHDTPKGNTSPVAEIYQKIL
ncbi:MAG: hypothetical protein Q8R04_02815 [Nanoarchaeota archaeon]|nr:hypothetical protein [Nanoarchaeota archaeon]